MAASTGLRSASGPARARATDRCRLGARQRLEFPASGRSHLEKLDPTRVVGSSRMTERLAGPLASAGRVVTGAQMGAVLGWLSTGSSASTTFCSPRMPSRTRIWSILSVPTSSLSSSFTISSRRQFRLWLALHEVTHRCQFTAIPWMRDDFVSLVEEGIGSLEPDPSRFAEALRRMTEEIRAGRNPLRDNGALGLVATPEQLEGLAPHSGPHEPVGGPRRCDHGPGRGRRHPQRGPLQ